MTGSTTPFHLQSLNVRQQILQSWSNSYLPPLRLACKLFGTLSKQVWLKTSPTYAKLIGFPRIPVHGTEGKGYDYNFIQFPRGESPNVVEVDVVIVGSGCGGGVCAKNLAEAGLKVLVVDKAYHFSTKHLPMTQIEGPIHLFENGGAEFSDDSSIAVLAGQAWGGGGTVNWSASLQTQNFVRQEWADGGLPFFASADFQDSLDRVCTRMGVSTKHIEHNRTNQVLSEGARRLGYSSPDVPQNTGGNKHYDGYCTFGCGAAEKQGPVVSWLPDAARAGARFIEGFTADKVTFADGKRTATGVQGTWRSRDGSAGVTGSDRYTKSVTIKAKKTIISCGSLQSPLLLMRSGLTNPQIGRNLHLHPVSLVAAVFPDEVVNPWEGGILTTVVTSLENLDGHGHGSKLEAMTMLPAVMLPFIPWQSAPHWKEFASKFKNMVAFISLARDKDTGRVYPDKEDGKCHIAYTPSPQDRKHILEGIVALAKISQVMGAKEILTSMAGVPFFVRDQTQPDLGVNDPKFQEWISQIRKKGLPDPDNLFGSAHQMGTCRMGSSERSSVVDQEGKVWGTDGLYVADASVFPSASGVNPMITNMAISDWTSRNLAKRMKFESGERARL